MEFTFAAGMLAKFEHRSASNVGDPRQRMIVPSAVRLEARDARGDPTPLPPGSIIACRLERVESALSRNGEGEGGGDEGGARLLAMPRLVGSVRMMDGLRDGYILWGDLNADRTVGTFKKLEVERGIGEGQGEMRLVFFVHDGGTGLPMEQFTCEARFMFVTDEATSNLIDRIREELDPLKAQVAEYEEKQTTLTARIGELNSLIRRESRGASRGGVFRLVPIPPKSFQMEVRLIEWSIIPPPPPSLQHRERGRSHSGHGPRESRSAPQTERGRKMARTRLGPDPVSFHLIVLPHRSARSAYHARLDDALTLNQYSADEKTQT